MLLAGLLGTMLLYRRLVPRIEYRGADHSQRLAQPT
jgi:hypothetical protein